MVSNPVYEEAARGAANALMSQFPGYSIYWQLGHAFDTLNDYFFRFQSAKEAADFAAVVLEKFLNRGVRLWVKTNTEIAKDPWWYDDFGWWGIAALRAGIRPCSRRMPTSR